MNVTVWGGRGSRPVPLSAESIRSKIATIVQRIRPSDIESPESRERFLSSLPPWLFGTVGGNTACVQVDLGKRRTLVFDAGSGIVEFGLEQRSMLPPPREYHILFTHLHYDHIQGFPFFAPMYDPRVTLHFYSPLPNLREDLTQQMRHPYFPIEMEAKVDGQFRFHQLIDTEIDLLGARIRWRELNHPGRAFGYRVDHGGASFGYVTDVELKKEDFERTADNIAFFDELDAMILDTQYTLNEAIEKYSWGHSAFSLGVEFASAWRARRLLLFHHEPLYDDKKLNHNADSAQWYAKRIGNERLRVDLAWERRTIAIDGADR